MQDVAAHLPLSAAAFHVMVALAPAEKHGYAIMGDVEELSGGTVKMGPGTLYGTLKRLVGDGLVEESDRRPQAEFDDQRRRYYRLTPFGVQVCAAESQRLARLASFATRHLNVEIA